MCCDSPRIIYKEILMGMGRNVRVVIIIEVRREFASSASIVGPSTVIPEITASLRLLPPSKDAATLEARQQVFLLLLLQLRHTACLAARSSTSASSPRVVAYGRDFPAPHQVVPM